MTPSRKYLSDGPIYECALDAKAGKDFEKLWFFLFNDALLITERKKDEKYQFRALVDFAEDTLRMKEISDSSGMINGVHSIVLT